MKIYMAGPRGFSEAVRRGDFRLSADNEGSIVNLQVEYFICQSGGEIISKLDEFETALKKI
jgi:hypothetical protein